MDNWYGAIHWLEYSKAGWLPTSEFQEAFVDGVFRRAQESDKADAYRIAELMADPKDRQKVLGKTSREDEELRQAIWEERERKALDKFADIALGTPRDPDLRINLLIDEAFWGYVRLGQYDNPPVSDLAALVRHCRLQEEITTGIFAYPDLARRAGVSEKEITETMRENSIRGQLIHAILRFFKRA